MHRFALLLALLVAACGHVDYDAAPAGRFKGTLFVMWVGEGGSAGDGRFVYVPNPRDPLRLVRAKGTPRVIQPEMIYTDGGSIPRGGQMFNGFAPWGYAPAYMIHDWLFVARHCLTDGAATEAEREIAAMEFQDSAEIIAEAIKALIVSGQVRPNDVAPRVISGAVAGPISYRRRQLRPRPGQRRGQGGGRGRYSRLGRRLARDAQTARRWQFGSGETGPGCHHA